MAWRYNLPKCPVSPADRGEFMKPSSTSKGQTEASQAQHFDLPKGQPARFTYNGELRTCQCSDCLRKVPSSVSTPAQDATALADELHRLISQMPGYDNPKNLLNRCEVALRATSQTPNAVREAVATGIMSVVSSRDDLGYTHFIEIRDAVFKELSTPSASASAQTPDAGCLVTVCTCRPGPCSTPSASAGPQAEAVDAAADAIDAARYAHPDHPRERPRSFAEADRSDRDYAFRLARAALRAASAASAAEAEMTNERRNSDGLNRQARNPEEVPDAGPKVENAKAFQEGITGGQTSHRQVGMPRYVMSESKAIDWTKPIETRERLPRPAKYLGPVEGGTIDYVLVSIGEGDSSFHHPAGEYRALKDTGFIRGTIALRNVASAGPQAEAVREPQIYTAELLLNGKYTWCIVKAFPRVENVIQEFGYGPDAYRTAETRLPEIKALYAHPQPQQADGRKFGGTGLCQHGVMAVGCSKCAPADGAVIERLTQIAMDVLHHDTSEGSVVDRYERNKLRREFRAALQQSRTDPPNE